MEYYSDVREEIPSFATVRMELEDIMLSETSQKEREILHGITYMCNLKKVKRKGEKEREPSNSYKQ